MAFRHVDRMGHPYSLRRSSRVQSVQLPDGLGLAARQRDHRHGLQILWLRRGGGTDRARHLPDLTVHDLRVGKHKLDICFWRGREREQTAFEVIKGDPKLVERCDIRAKLARLRTASDPL